MLCSELNFYKFLTSSPNICIICSVRYNLLKLHYIYEYISFGDVLCMNSLKNHILLSLINGCKSFHLFYSYLNYYRLVIYVVSTSVCLVASAYLHWFLVVAGLLVIGLSFFLRNFLHLEVVFDS